ncbi:MAG: prepilin-type N-terminal cleavage/methylation domain-containing protein [Clostridia bacterium]
MKNQNKGITLIALVVTIIILLILAGVTIYFVIKRRGAILR